MTGPPDFPASHAPVPHDRFGLRALWHRDGRAVLAAGGATLAIELAVFFLVRSAAGETFAALACLAAGTVWLALAAAPLGAGGGDWLSSLLRAGVLADASAITLVVLWTVSPAVSLRAAVEVYCVYLAMVLFAVAAVRCPKSHAGRYTAAVIAAVVMMLAVATPFWTGGLLRAVERPARRAVLAVAVRTNPFYAVVAALFDRTGFVWSEARTIYAEIHQINDPDLPSATWYGPAAVWLIVAGILATTHLFRRPTYLPDARRD